MKDNEIPLGVKILLILQQTGMLLFWLTNYLREPIVILIVFSLGGLSMAVSFMIIFALLLQHMKQPYINHNPH